MSWRIGLAQPARRTCDFLVPDDGTVQDAVLKYEHQRPIRVIAGDADLLRAFLMAWDEAVGVADLWQIHWRVTADEPGVQLGPDHPATVDEVLRAIPRLS